jgi:hypothetical protein
VPAADPLSANPLAVEVVTIQDVSAALQAAAARTDAATAFGVLKKFGAANLTALAEEHWAAAIAEANAIV